MRSVRLDVGFIGEVEGGVLNGFEQGLHALHCSGAGVDERLDGVVEVGVADLLHVDRAERIARRGGNDDEVVGVDARVGAGGREHGFE